MIINPRIYNIGLNFEYILMESNILRSITYVYNMSIVIILVSPNFNYDYYKLIDKNELNEIYITSL